LVKTKLTEKYRPHKWEDMIGQDTIVSRVKAIVDRKGPYPHFLFCGPPGSGKTTLAMIFASETGMDLHEYNASDDRTLTFVREQIKKLAEFAGERVILLDEADMLRSDAQMALKRIMETSNSIFVLCANDEWKIDDAIKSRCAIFRFERIPDSEIEKRVVDIIVKEGFGIVQDPTVALGLKKLVENARGDLRTALNDLESIVDEHNTITVDSVALPLGKTDLPILALTKALEGDFDTARQMIEKSYIEGKYNPRTAFKEIYNSIPKLDAELDVKIRMFEKLGEVERGFLMGGDPIIQLVTYFAFVWLIPHASKCPHLG